MADQPRRPRTLGDARTEAEAAFKKVTAKVAAAPPKQNAVPGIKEQVTLRIDQDVLAFFQEGGPGWQDRINEALRKGRGEVGAARSASAKKKPGASRALS
ncbi:BrnA antitoxin family protein [Bradyrhizobium sp. DOA1]|uniref:BrnA antitoxin family protein n=1 Tax=Bradyrhizobium sp. DOA1 TaxID=1126616 RepID=UPI000A58E836|nr:BrnA antitoxin family protein [Bradyrhizobium sp. DOA1]